jgi:DNA-binding transcriptional MerR regulator
MKIGELAHQSGLSAHTIRYYERIGLLPKADRDQSGQRNYDRSIHKWIEFLGHLKATGMPIREMLAYANLRQLGDESALKRRDMLIKHRHKVAADIASLQKNLAVLDAKIDGYNQQSKGTNSDK